MAITYESLRNFVRKSGVEVRVYAPEAEVIFLKDATEDTISVIDKATAFLSARGGTLGKSSRNLSRRSTMNQNESLPSARP